MTIKTTRISYLVNEIKQAKSLEKLSEIRHELLDCYMYEILHIKANDDEADLKLNQIRLLHNALFICVDKISSIKGEQIYD